MRIKKSALARKYAKAFLNVNHAKLPDHFVWNVKRAYDFLNGNMGLMLIFALPTFSKKAKSEAIHAFLKKFNLGPELGKLFELLLRHGRPMLFREVLKHIRTLYSSYSDALLFNFSSASELSKDDQEVLKKFVESETGKTVIFESELDESLVAGVRLQSQNLLWDCSVKGRLDRLKVLAVRG